MMKYSQQQLHFAEEILSQAIEDLGPIRRRTLERRLSRDNNLRRDLVVRTADELDAKQMLPADGQAMFLSPGQLEEIFDIIRQLLPLLIRLFGLFG
jgi:hypothetical protein